MFAIFISKIRWFALLRCALLFDKNTVGTEMLRVKVQSWKWECLLCSRTFTSKFCYLLHSKNVHRKTEEAKFIQEPRFRPKTKEKFFEVKKQKSRYSTRSSDSQCYVCKKVYSTKEKLAKHRKLHLNKTKNGWNEEDDDDHTEKDEKNTNKTTLSENEITRDESMNASVSMTGKKCGRPKKNKDKPQETGSNSQETGDKSQETGNGISTTDVIKPKRKRGRPRKDQAEKMLNYLVGVLEGVEKEKDAQGCPLESYTMVQVGETLENAATLDALQCKAPDDGITQDNAKRKETVQGTFTKVIAPKPSQAEEQVKPAKKPRVRKKLPRECEVCKKIFSGRSSLRAHMRIHTGEKPYTCSVCKKAFIRMGHLKQHMCSHTGVWPFNCATCGKGFMSPSRVSRHMRVHSDDRPFVCDACGEGFKEPHHLTRHFFLHTGEKPFKCPICQDRFFIQPGNLRIHMKTHEKDITDGSLVVKDVSKVVKPSDQRESTTEPVSEEEQQAALGGLAIVSAHQLEAGELKQDLIENLEKEHGYSERRSESTNNTLTDQNASSAGVDKSIQRNEILLQVMPNIAPTIIQLEGFQDLSSIDQEFLRQFASTVAQELVNVNSQ